METTIYDKAGFSPIILLLPLIEKKLPAYYEALDLDNLTKATVEHDATYIQNIIKTLNDLDIVDPVSYTHLIQILRLLMNYWNS